MKKVPLIVVEQMISENAADIKSLDDHALPMVLAEIQAEQAYIEYIKDHRTITDVCRDAVEHVLPCWANDKGEVIIDKLFAE